MSWNESTTALRNEEIGMVCDFQKIVETQNSRITEAEQKVKELQDVEKTLGNSRIWKEMNIIPEN